MDEAARICARLLREGAVPRSELTALDHPEIREDVEQRLAAVGLTLATSAYSDHVGIRLSADIAADRAFDSASNLGLRADACALLVVLWARLVLQKRTAVETREVPGQVSLLSDDRATAAKQFTPSVRLETLVREFGPIVGKRTHLKGLVAQLRRLGFAAGRGEVVEPGPLMELAIDGERMVAFIRRGVLAELLASKSSDGAASSPAEDLEQRTIAALAELGGTAPMAELERVLQQRRQVLREVLGALVESGRVRRVGNRATTRYQLVETT